VIALTNYNIISAAGSVAFWQLLYVAKTIEVPRFVVAGKRNYCAGFVPELQPKAPHTPAKNRTLKSASLFGFCRL
jgi:hypothetical protein